jgi:nucleotide-binding universal stress UspA family protein
LFSSTVTRTGIPFVESIVHPTDLAPTSRAAFSHALVIALIQKARFEILHVGDETPVGWDHFPGVRDTLERWGLLEPGSERSEVFDELGIEVTKMQLAGDPVRATLDFVHANEPDLLVLGTRGREGLASWLDPSVAQRIARRSRTMTLFVPDHGRFFVSSDDGRLSLRRILVPVDRTPDASEALARAARAAAALGDPPVVISLLHVGPGPIPYYDLPEGDAWTWEEQLREGSVAEEILAAADSLAADLIVMPTDGRNGVLDVLRGSFTERVVAQASCPVLAVPAATR